jgi:hypothetical protein
MAKVSSKNGVIVIGGYSLSSFAADYTVDYSNNPLDVTGFGDGWQNFIPGEFSGQMALNMYWDTAANSTNAALLAMGKKCVTIIPDGYVLGNPCVTMYAEQANFNPTGDPSAALMVSNVLFQTSGVDGGPLPAQALAHGTITDTTTGTGFVDDTDAAVTQRCAGVLHVWTPCAADTYVVKIQHATSVGGAYSDLVTFTLNGSARASEKVAVASGTINKYRRVLATRTGSAGNSFGFTVAFWHAGM